MSLRARYQLLFIILFTALAYGMDTLFDWGILRRYPFFFGMIPVVVAMWTANYVIRKKAERKG